MTSDFLTDHLSRIQRIETTGGALKSTGDMDITSFKVEGLLDELYETDQDNDKDDAEEWMDDYMDDAA